MDGLFIIDKPEGKTSFDVIRFLRKRFPKVKMGYLGTLDPMASGVLVVFLGAATRYIRFFSDLPKTYEVTMELGKISDTFDRTGKIFEMPAHEFPSEERIQRVFQAFLGPQWQIQPAFSAIHYQGKRAYEFARQGKKINLGKRQVEIFSLKLTKTDRPWISFQATVSSGTYIRSLVHELGQIFKSGAIVSTLRRLSVGYFVCSKAILLDQVQNNFLIPMSDFTIFTDQISIPHRQIVNESSRKVLAPRKAIF